MYLQVLALLVLVSVSQCLECTNAPIYITDGEKGEGVLFCMGGSQPGACEIEDPDNPFDTSSMRSVNVTAKVVADMKVQCAAQTRKKRQAGNVGWYLNGAYPGTKWCGEGNEAIGFEDFGDHRETDTCCRDHDNGCGNANNIILPFTCPSNSICTMAETTRHHCDCDNYFKACLKRVTESPNASAEDKQAAENVGGTYFDHLGQTCYRMETNKHVWQDVLSFNSS